MQLSPKSVGVEGISRRSIPPPSPTRQTPQDLNSPASPAAVRTGLLAGDGKRPTTGRDARRANAACDVGHRRGQLHHGRQIAQRVSGRAARRMRERALVVMPCEYGEVVEELSSRW